MSDLDAKIRLGKAAERVLEDELVKHAFDAVVEDLKNAWVSTRPDDTATREACFRMAFVTGLVMNKLQAWKADGLKAQDDIKHKDAEARGLQAFH